MTWIWHNIDWGRTLLFAMIPPLVLAAMTLDVLERWRRAGWTARLLLLAAILFGLALTVTAAQSAKDGPFGQTTAAWLQAFGSIAAVVGAGWLAGRQSREAFALEERERHRAEQERADVDRASLLLASRLVSMMTVKIEAFVKGLEDDGVKSIGVATLAHFNSARRRLESYPLEKLRPPDAVLLYARAIEVSDLTVGMIETAVDGAPHASPVAFLRARLKPLKSFRDEAKSVEEALRDYAEPKWRDRAMATVRPEA